MKKNNTAEKAILDAEAITTALKEGTQNSLKSMMAEAINRMINESDEEDDEDSFEVEDVETEEGNDVEDATADTDVEDTPSEEVVADEEGQNDADDDEWSDMEEYKVGDNDYDFTGVEGDELLKVYSKLGDDDKIFVKPVGDGKYELNDEETGAEYVIELDADSECLADDEDFDAEGDEDMEIEIVDDDDFGAEDEGDDEEVEFEFGDDDDETEYDDDEDDEELLNEENLGYTDTYQKDVMPGLKMNEPANKKATYSMDGGVPDGNKRPYSGYENKESNLFTKNVNEDGPMENIPSAPSTTDASATLEEDGSGLNTKHSTKHSSNHINKSAQNQRHSHENGTYHELQENMKKIVTKARAIQNENKQYANALNKIKQSLKEAAVLNVTLAQVVKLLSENTATNEEKKSIVERFSEVKTINEGKALYNTVKRELNESKQKSVVLERQMTVDASKALNETTMYQKEGNPSISLWDRMEGLYQK